jgi:hypothetical protein
MMSTNTGGRRYPYASTKPANANNLLSQTERLEIVKQKTNTCIDAANAEYYVNGVYVKPQASCLPGSTENQTCKTSRVRQQQLQCAPNKLTASALPS